MNNDNQIPNVRLCTFLEMQVLSRTLGISACEENESIMQTKTYEAIKANNPDVIACLGDFSMHHKDYQDAEIWYLKLITKDTPDHIKLNACTELTKIYYRGLGMPQDMNQAMIYSKMAADLGHHKSMHNFGVFCLNALNSLNAKKDQYLDYARLYLSKAVVLGVKDSIETFKTLKQENYKLFIQGSLMQGSALFKKKNYEDAYPLLQVAADNGNQKAKDLLSDIGTQQAFLNVVGMKPAN